MSERNALVAYRAVEELPKHLRSDRLREIFLQMQALKSRELTVDSGLMGYQIVVSGISQVEMVRKRSVGFLVVETLIYDLDKGTNAMLSVRKGRSNFPVETSAPNRDDIPQGTSRMVKTQWSLV